jgi:hypothetical protein
VRRSGQNRVEEHCVFADAWVLTAIAISGQPASLSQVIDADPR